MRAPLCATAARGLSPGEERSNAPTARVSAKVDVGFGNALYIRGQGAGLSWDRGLPLECVEDATWIWSTHDNSEPVTFKLLINDQLWCRGEDLRAAPGALAEVTPMF